MERVLRSCAANHAATAKAAATVKKCSQQEKVLGLCGL
jgi:hypothetical protein